MRSDPALLNDLPADLLVEVKLTGVFGHVSHLIYLDVLDAVLVALHLLQDLALLIVSLVLEEVSESYCLVRAFLWVRGGSIWVNNWLYVCGFRLSISCLYPRKSWLGGVRVLLSAPSSRFLPPSSAYCTFSSIYA
jgi:hypothetical protein